MTLFAGILAIVHLAAATELLALGVRAHDWRTGLAGTMLLAVSGAFVLAAIGR